MQIMSAMAKLASALVVVFVVTLSVATVSAVQPAAQPPAGAVIQGDGNTWG